MIICDNTVSSGGVLVNAIYVEGDCLLPNYKDDGTGLCVRVTDNCNYFYKDDGTGILCIGWSDACAEGFKSDGRSSKDCIPVADPCASNYKDDGTGTNCVYYTYACASGYRNDGRNGVRCSPINESCYEGYKDDGAGKCVL